jgi:hypothetical protein
VLAANWGEAGAQCQVESGLKIDPKNVGLLIDRGLIA